MGAALALDEPALTKGAVVGALLSEPLVGAGAAGPRGMRARAGIDWQPAHLEIALEARLHRDAEAAVGHDKAWQGVSVHGRAWEGVGGRGRL